MKNLLEDEAVVVGSSNHSHATADLYDAIAAGDYPEWKLLVQVRARAGGRRTLLPRVPRGCHEQALRCTLPPQPHDHSAFTPPAVTGEDHQRRVCTAGHHMGHAAAVT